MRRRLIPMLEYKHNLAPELFAHNAFDDVCLFIDTNFNVYSLSHACLSRWKPTEDVYTRLFDWFLYGTDLHVLGSCVVRMPNPRGYDWQHCLWFCWFSPMPPDFQIRQHHMSCTVSLNARILYNTIIHHLCAHTRHLWTGKCRVTAMTTCVTYVLTARDTAGAEHATAGALRLQQSWSHQVSAPSSIFFIVAHLYLRPQISNWSLEETALLNWVKSTAVVHHNIIYCVNW